MASIEILGSSNNAPKEVEKPKETDKKKTNKIVNFFKKKPFMLAVIVVAGLGLYSWYRKSQTVTSSSEESAEGYFIPTTYTYPSYSNEGAGGVYSDTAYTEDVFNTMKEAFDNQAETLTQAYNDKLTEIQGVYDTSTQNLVSQMESLSNRVNESENVVKNQTTYIEMQNDIDAMKRNSDNYHYATTTAQKQALHDANKAIADKWGWSFNDDDGYYYDSEGSRVYSTATQEAKATETISTKKASSSGGTVKSASSSSSSSSSTSTMGKAGLGTTTSGGASTVKTSNKQKAYKLPSGVTVYK